MKRFLFCCLMILSVVLIPESKALADDARWSFVIFGDTRGDDPGSSGYDPKTATGVSPVLADLAFKIASMHPDFVLHVGDLTSGDLYQDMKMLEPSMNIELIPYAKQFRAFKDAVRPITHAKIPLYTVRGNHEVSCLEGLDDPDPGLAKAYKEAFGKNMPQNYNGVLGDQKGLTYSFTHKQVTVVAMDQYARYVAPKPPPLPGPYAKTKTNVWGTNFWGYHTVDLAWMRDQLKKAKTPFKIILAHEPVYPANGIMDPAAYGYNWYFEQYFGPEKFGGIAQRQKFVDMMGMNGAQLYAVGHVHNMSVGSIKDSSGHTVYQLTAGNGGAYPMNSEKPAYVDPELHDVKYELHNPGFTLATVDPKKNTMTLEYFVMDPTTRHWSKEDFTTTMAGTSV